MLCKLCWHVRGRTKQTSHLEMYLWFSGLMVVITVIFIFHYLSPNEKSDEESHHEITIVTAYFDLGEFEKGTDTKMFYSSKLYEKWFAAFSLIKNPVVCYLDRPSPFVEIFKKHRERFPAEMTKIIEIDRNKTWAFGLLPRISAIFSRTGYPKHSPNTVLPEYSAVMHLKYELMKRSVNENPFHTAFFAWLDVGLFRLLTPVKRNERQFRLRLPPFFPRNSDIAYTKVFNASSDLTAEEIVRGNQVWVCGAYFVGGGTVMLRWTEEYMRGVVAMMDETNFMSTDQQVIYWLFSNKARRGITTSIKTYSGNDHDPWFHLGYASRGYDSPMASPD